MLSGEVRLVVTSLYEGGELAATSESGRGLTRTRVRLEPGAVDGGGYETVDDGAVVAYGLGVSSGSGGRGFELTYRWNTTSRAEIGALGTDRDMARCGGVVKSVLLTLLSASYRNSIAALRRVASRVRRKTRSAG